MYKLQHIRGRAAGDGTGRPKFTGTLSPEGLIRIDCENYPAHWQEIQLPEAVVKLMKWQAAGREKPAEQQEEKTSETIEILDDEPEAKPEPGMGGLQTKLLAVDEAQTRKKEQIHQAKKRQKLLPTGEPRAIGCAV